MDRPAETSVQRAEHIMANLPPEGLFSGHSWRISPDPFPLDLSLVRELESLGRVLLKFYQAVDLLHRQSRSQRQPGWVARLLDQGKPPALLELQEHPSFKSAVPRVIRPDILLTDEGFVVTELDSVPGGIGLTAWLNRTYSELGDAVIGGPSGMLEGFEGIFDGADDIHILVSSESETYRPEMRWLAGQYPTGRFSLRDETFDGFSEGDAVYRFFELFDLANIPASSRIFEMAKNGLLTVTPPPKPVFEEKLLLGLLWNRPLNEFWRQQLGEGFLRRMRQHVPMTWVIDPAPLPPHAVYPEIDLHDWQQLKMLSQRERDLILKVSGYSERAWGARGVHLGSDLSLAEWSTAVDEAIGSFPQSPYILQRYHKPSLIDARWIDFEQRKPIEMKGRVRLCPYYFVRGRGDGARARLGGVLATICPADKKIIHGMSEAILAPCKVAD